MNVKTYDLAKVVHWLVRLALASAFLSAVADRFGLWGAPGANGVAWGDWNRFLDYVATMNGYAPAAIIPALAWVATVAEVVIAFGLIAGWRLQWFALAAGALLTTFALAMTVSFGIKPPLDYSVFSAAAGAFLLAISSTADGAERKKVAHS